MDVWGMIVYSEVSTCVQQVVMSLVVIFNKLGLPTTFTIIFAV